MKINVATKAITQRQFLGVQLEWEKIAKESLTIREGIEFGEFYAFGSEVACLRLYSAFRGNGRISFSENLKSWYFINVKTK